LILPRDENYAQYLDYSTRRFGGCDLVDPESKHGGEADSSEEVARELIVARRDASKILDPTEHALNHVALPASLLVERQWEFPRCPARDNGSRAATIAELLYQRALAIAEKELGPDQNIASLLNNLASFHGADKAPTSPEGHWVGHR
jgi:hypothetical protein